MPPVHISSSGLGRNSSQRVYCGLDSPKRTIVRLPSDKPDSIATPTSQSTQESGGPLSPTVARETVVHTSPKLFSENLAVTSLLFASKGRPLPGYMPASRILQSTRMDCVKRFLKPWTGNEPANLIATRLAPSTTKQYDSVFHSFQVFVRSKGWQVLNVSRILAFFTDSFNRGLSYKTLLVYRAALYEPVLYALNVDLHSPIVSNFFTALQKKRPPRRTLPPTWSLKDVLDLLSTEEWCAFDISPQQALQKAMFLVALSSGSRISELCSLRRDSNHMQISPSHSVIHFTPSSSFRFKTQRVLEGLQMWTLPAFLLNESRDHHRLCPVKALLTWLEISKNWPNPSSALWLHPTSKKPLNSNRVNYFFRTLVNLTLTEPVAIHAHQIRHLSASVSFYQGLSIEKICARCMWSNQDTFVKHYLHPVERNLPPCISLGFQIG